MIHIPASEQMPKMLYLNFFGKIVSTILDDKIENTIVLECIDQNALIAVRNGIINELSNDQPVVIKYAVYVDIQVNILITYVILNLFNLIYLHSRNNYVYLENYQLKINIMLILLKKLKLKFKIKLVLNYPFKEKLIGIRFYYKLIIF